MSTEVLIVGAGPTGLMAAALLSRCGISIRIIDKNKDQAHESRALGIQAKSMELFQSIGIIDKILERGMITKGMQLYINGKRKGEIGFQDLGRTDTPYSFLLMLSQAETEKILCDDLAQRGITVERGMELIACNQDSDSVTVTIKDREGMSHAEKAQYVIGADGAHSFIRQALGLEFKGGAYPQDFALGDVQIDWPLEHDRLCVFFHGKSFGAHFPLKGKSFGRVLAIASDQQSELGSTIGSVPMTLDDLQKAFEKVTAMPTKLSDPQWLARFHIHHRGVEKYRIGRIFVAGDAAHIHSPIGAQGMNTGLQDVANLCWKLSMVLKNQAPDKLLDTYQAERWPVGQKLLNFTDRLFVLIATQNSMFRFIRDRVFGTLAPLTRKFAAIRYRAFNFVSQLGIRYHPNPFIQGDPKSKLSPGYRAPNAKTLHGKEIFDFIHGYKFHLLVMSLKKLSAEQMHEFDDLPSWVQVHVLSSDANVMKDVFKKYQITERYPSALYLIRPDGYIAYRSNDVNPSRLKVYLKQFEL